MLLRQRKLVESGSRQSPACSKRSEKKETRFANIVSVVISCLSLYKIVKDESV
jgi:hypothetical protein